MPFWPDRFHLETVLSGTAAAPFVGALDGFSPDYAWSHRRALLTSFTGNLLQARRTSDDALYAVPLLPNGEGNASGLVSFVGGGTATVAALVEQVGTGYAFIQPTADVQRIIVDSGSLVTVGGKAASRGLRGPLSPDVVGGGMFTPSFTAYTGSTLSIFLRGAHDVYDPAGWFGGIADAYIGMDRSSDFSWNSYIYRAPSGEVGLSRSGSFGGAFNSDYLISIIFDGTNVTFRDGTNTYTVPGYGAFIHDRFIFGYAAGASVEGNSSLYNRWQEAAVWMSDQTANEAAIRSALMA